MDAPPIRYNIRGLLTDQANMDLKRAEDAMYVGKVFRDKAEVWKTLSLYALERLFHFMVSI